MADADSTSRPCRKCGTVFSGPYCMECRRLYREANREKARATTAAWRLANPGKNAQISKRWREANPEKAKASVEATRAKYPDADKERSALYRASHREIIRAKTAAWRAANLDRSRASVIAYRLANPQKIAAMLARYRAANAEVLKQKCAAWRVVHAVEENAKRAAKYAANPERYKSLALKWAKDNPDKKRAYRQNRRARVAKEKLSPDIAIKLLKLQRGKCACCAKPLGTDYHLDHIVPLALGGRNVDSNMQLLTQRCNNQKHEKDPIDFMQSRGFLL